MASKKGRRSKYNAEKVRTAYGTFDSKKEYKRFLQLKALHEDGVIHGLEVHPQFIVIPRQFDEKGKCIEKASRYVADFSYIDSDGRYVVEDVKGYRTGEYIMKRKLMLERHSIRIKEV